MNTTSTLHTTAVVLFLMAAGAAHAGSTVAGFVAGDTTAPPCRQGAELSGLDARIVDKASQGVGALRQYLWVTRGIYGLDMTNTVAWLDQQRAEGTMCVRNASSVTGR